MHSAARSFREKIARGRPVLGTMLVEFSGPAVVSAAVNAGLDFVIIDAEHGNFAPREIEITLEVSSQAQLPAFIRPPTIDRGLLTRSLDAGAAGALIPFVSTLEDARLAVQATKYTPVGRRGVHLMRGHTRHRPTSPAQFMAEANRDLLTMIQIELREAVLLVDQIAELEGVDVLYVGPGDLSADLGVPGQWDSAVVRDAIARTAAACRRHGKIMACHVGSVAAAQSLSSLGVEMFGLEADIVLLQQALSERVAEFQLTHAIAVQAGRGQERQ